jgi:prophage tail gpP-like protein
MKAMMSTAADKPRCGLRRPVIVAERYCTDEEMKTRVQMDSENRDAQSITATISVYGWLTGGKSGDLWKPGHTVKVKSKTAGLSQETLWLKAVTFTQDNQSGTQTHLELLARPVGQVQLVPQKGTSPDPVAKSTTPY